MGYSVKGMSKAYEAGKVATAINIAAHIAKDGATAKMLKEAYTMMKANKVDEVVVTAATKEVERMLGMGTEIEATETTTEEVTTMEENTKVTVEAEDVNEEPAAPEANEDPWVLVTGKRKDKEALYVFTFVGDLKAELARISKEGFPFVCVSRVSAWEKFLTNNWKRGTLIPKYLERKGVTDADKFAKGILEVVKAADGNVWGVRVDTEGNEYVEATEEAATEEAA